MIAIVNIDPSPRPTGKHLYQLRINSKEICQFTHNREDGLDKCLLAAAKAVEAARWIVMAEMMRDKETTHVV